MFKRWSALACRLNLNTRVHFHFTSKSGPSHNIPPSEWAAEHEATPHFLLLMLVEVMGNRLKKKYDASYGVFLAIFNDIVSSAAVAKLYVKHQIALTHAGLCRVNPILDGKCWHVRSAERTLKQCRAASENPYEVSVMQFFEVVNHDYECPAVKSFCIEFLNELADAMCEKRWLGTFEDDFIGHASSLVLKSKDGSKRMRLDSVACQKIVEQAAVKNANTTAGFLRAHPSLFGDPSQAGRMLDERFCRWLTCANWGAFARTTKLSLAFDCVRSGNPATDDIICSTEDVETKLSTWCPPTDTGDV